MKNKYLFSLVKPIIFFVIFVFSFVFSDSVSADLRAISGTSYCRGQDNKYPSWGYLCGEQANLSSIEHGKTFEPGDSVTFRGFVLARDTDIACKASVGFGTQWSGEGPQGNQWSESPERIKYALGIIPGNLVVHSDGKTYCEFNETLTIPNVEFREDKKFRAMVYALYQEGGMSSYSNRGTFWEHVYINPPGGERPVMRIQLDAHGCSAVTLERLSVSKAKKNAQPCTFTSTPDNEDWNSLILTTGADGSGSIPQSKSIKTPDFNNGRLTLNVSCVDDNGQSASSSVVTTSQTPCACTPPKPVSTLWHPGDNENLTESQSSKYSEFDNEEQCEFYCPTGSTWNGFACVVIPSYSCTGLDPANALLCSGDDTDLSENRAKTLVNSCSLPVGSAPKCEFICKFGFTFDLTSNSCIDSTPQYSLNVSKDGPGSVSCTPTNCSSTNVNKGVSITLRATKDANAIFNGWTSDGENKCPNILENCSFLMTKDETIVAHFDCENGYTLIGGICRAVEGKCNTTYTTSCYEGDLSEKGADELCINSRFGSPSDPKYASGKWSWTCQGGTGSAVTCETNQCARYKEVTP
ncbi:MAG: hypothetical protein IPN70_03410 [Candidatus Moraniibacteriota bacterium]|nr:MAG: hypothetical protein IPN70_03410 [Candidatus Moranbacteria bacterium]